MKISRNIKNWKAKSLFEVSTFIRGVVFSTNDQVDLGGYAILRSHNVDFENNKVTLHNLKYVSDNVKVKDSQRLKKNDILISVANSKEQTGKVGFSFEDTDTYAGGFMAILRANETINPYFLFNYLLTIFAKNYIAGRTQGTTNIFNITFKRIKDLPIPLPPLEEQKRIAALFQSIDAAIEETEAQEKNLLQTKRKLLNDLFDDSLGFGTFLQPNDYETTSFENIANHISERIDPANSSAEIYVGLEHLDPDNLQIERTGKPADVKGTKLKIYKDDIIFGKRRAYLRKVAVSHFDGICSAHSMVLRAIGENIEKDFLPFFMQSDYFMERAIQISEGSLSPTIKWKVLATQEFHLPRQEKQNTLVTLFKQIDNTIHEIRGFKTNLKNLKQNLLNEILG